MPASPADAGPLEPVEDRFVELWHNMAGLWGVSPTMARVHGLLYISGQALSMDAIMARLGISRGNVSMSLARLVEWGLVRKVRRRGDRKEYFESLGDAWEMFTLVARERKRREIDPILTTLRQCRDDLAPAAGADPAAERRLARIAELLKLLTLLDGLAQRFFESHRGLRAAVERLAGD